MNNKIYTVAVGFLFSSCLAGAASGYNQPPKEILESNE